jgi:hypothetical protein
VKDSWRPILAATALGVGIVLFIALLLAVLDIARIEQSHEGPVFQRAANILRWLVLGEIALVLGTGAVILWRRRSPTAQLVWLASVVWVGSAVDLTLVALSGAVPR